MELHATFEHADLGGLMGTVEYARSLESMLLTDDSPTTCLVVERGKVLIGYATLTPQYSTWHAARYLYLDCLFLVESERGKGIGSRLMKRIAQLAQDMNCPHIEWQTPDFNFEAIRFYRRQGAEAKSKQRFVWRFDRPPIQTDESRRLLQDSNSRRNGSPKEIVIQPAALEPYRSRATWMTGTRTCNDWRLKIYLISFDSIPSDEVIEAAIAFAHRHVSWPTGLKSQFGFLIVHFGQQAVWLLVNLWIDDILRQFAYCAAINEPTRFSPIPMDGFNSCVWEQEVAQHERNAWVQCVLAFPDNPRHDDYLADALTIE
ncbi:MAG: GNAT family N-acetyltransferase [Pirellulaceae bacterium]